MNRSLLTVRITIIAFLFFNQQSSGMELISYGKRRLAKYWYGEEVHILQFGEFLKLPEGVDLLIFKHSDNKSNFQKINKEWYKKGSIKLPFFVDEFYRLGSRRMCCIFLNAVWEKNYDGVENILKHYYTKQPDHACCYSVGIDQATQNQIVLDPYEIASENKKMVQLLQTYKVNYEENEAIIFAAPAPLMMACLSGSSDLIKDCPKSSLENIKRALNIIVDCDHAKCMQDGSHVAFGSIFRIRSLFEWKHLRRACMNKSCKALKILLSSGCCNINEVVNGITLLDEVLKLAEQENSFSPVVTLLKEYGAKTAQQMIKDAEEPLFPLPMFL